MTISVYRMPISKEILDSIPEKERSLFIVVGHLSNELNIFSKLFFWASKFSDEEPVRHKANITQSLALARILAGKLFEGWNTIGKVYFSTKLSKEYHSLLSQEAKDALKELGKYFGKENIVMKIRNEFAFHYDHKQITDGFNALKVEEDWEIYLTEANGNSLYYVAELAANYALLNSIDSSDLKTAIETLVDELIQIGKLFTTFLGGCLVVISHRYFLNKDGKLAYEEECQLTDAPSIYDISIPYFVETLAPKP